MNDDRTDLEVFQQCRDLVFGDWTSAARSCCTTCSDVICVRSSRTTEASLKIG
jgi:hypothetical protein